MRRWVGRGINFGNALDVPATEEPSLVLEERYFDLVRGAGFDTIRLPVRWSAHAGQLPPYTIDHAFFAEVDRAINRAVERDLHVVLNVHHFDELNQTPASQTPRLLALWRQIAQRYAHQPQHVYFELLNEPRDQMTSHQWNALIPRALAAVRETNPSRRVIVGPAQMNTITALPDLQLPSDDNLIVTIHYYEPYEFTHQGAPWWPGALDWAGTPWGSAIDGAAVCRDLQTAAAWASHHDHPLLLGEFGTYVMGDPAQRAAWTACVRSEAERLGLSWAYWDFGTDFGVYDTHQNTWHPALLHALLPG